ncbi:peptide/nickel transport system substrate-binding protein [Alkalispirochaeta americana]|uniref:Peptide/nickel transport system substrate-binding protein n=1 Tax=Alkalispirochaeta americana TaxID=159291 RepID=A0A1N6QPK5_9SPIO|nr:ABC transporter substrate-binding protein [Alkalispirochaeta americana]SIQ18527.1 peptide/nickel transport system substrate-binding protein [Alkalispirochaeta americana]
MRLFFRDFRALAITVGTALIIGGLFISCGGAETEGEHPAKRDNAETLVVGMPGDPRSLDPHRTNDQPSSRVKKQIYDTLMYQTSDLTVTGDGLAESYEVISPTEFAFTLRQGVLFHNGEELTSEDVKFTFERMRELNAPAAFLVNALDRVEIIDDYNFVMHLSFPFGPFITHLAHPATAIINKKAVLEAGDNYGRNPVGTGPFAFVEWRSGDSLTLRRFDDHFRGPAASERVIFRIITEDTQRAIALETSEVDLIYDVGPNDFRDLAAIENVIGFQTSGLTTFYMGFNVGKEPFDDVRVRQAINLALDVEAATQVAFRGYATTAKGPLAPTVQFANTDLPGYGYDVERAKALLAEAGYPDGFSTSIWTNDNPVRVMYAEIFQEQLRAVGIAASIEIVEWAPYLDRTARGEHDMFMLGWVAVTGDADYGLYSLFHSEEFGDAGNRTFWAHEEVDRLLVDGKTNPDPQAREAAYLQAQKIIFEEAPWTFLAFRDELNATRDYVQGFQPHAAGHHILYQVYNN